MKPGVVPLPVFQIPLLLQPLLMIVRDPDLEPTEEDLVPALDLNLEGVAVLTSMDTFVLTFAFLRVNLPDKKLLHRKQLLLLSKGPGLVDKKEYCGRVKP